MASFDAALADVLQYEGGLADDPDDRGGRTMRGVTTETYNRYRTQQQLPLQDVALITDDEIRDIYYKSYWLAGHCHELPYPVSYVHFDACVNHGRHYAATLLQRAAGVTVDGIIGRQTLTACLRDDPIRLAQRYCDEREHAYQRLAQKPGQEKFLKGWLNRLTKVRVVVELARAA